MCQREFDTTLAQQCPDCAGEIAAAAADRDACACLANGPQLDSCLFGHACKRDPTESCSSDADCSAGKCNTGCPSFPGRCTITLDCVDGCRASRVTHLGECQSQFTKRVRTACRRIARRCFAAARRARRQCLKTCPRSRAATAREDHINMTAC